MDWWSNYFSVGMMTLISFGAPSIIRYHLMTAIVFNSPTSDRGEGERTPCYLSQELDQEICTDRLETMSNRQSHTKTQVSNELHSPLVLRFSLAPQRSAIDSWKGAPTDPAIKQLSWTKRGIGRTGGGGQNAGKRGGTVEHSVRRWRYIAFRWIMWN